MKNATKKQKSAIFSYNVYAHVRNVGETQNDDSNLSIDKEFINIVPLIARREAFEFIKTLESDLLQMTLHGSLNLCSPQVAKSRGWSFFTALSYTITFKVTDDNGNIIYEEPINNDEGQDVAIAGLDDEYWHYTQYGYDTGETMELEDGEIILMTDTRYIYNRS
jgi:hypothetical protein